MGSSSNLVCNLLVLSFHYNVLHISLSTVIEEYGDILKSMQQFLKKNVSNKEHKISLWGRLLIGEGYLRQKKVRKL